MVALCYHSSAFLQLYLSNACFHPQVYYEEREARRAARRAAQQSSSQQDPNAQGAGRGPNNGGYDDENYDYIFTPNEVINDRYVLQKRIGKGSFGQVVQALDKKTDKEVAIKIIKSKRPFLMQAKTEIALLTTLNDNDREDQNNIGTLLCDTGIMFVWHFTLFSSFSADHAFTVLSHQQSNSLQHSFTEIINVSSLRCSLLISTSFSKTQTSQEYP